MPIWCGPNSNVSECERDKECVCVRERQRVREGERNGESEKEGGRRKVLQYNQGSNPFHCASIREVFHLTNGFLLPQEYIKQLLRPNLFLLQIAVWIVGHLYQATLHNIKFSEIA